MSNISQFGGGAIKSIQRGLLTFSGVDTSAAATVSAVNTSKTELRNLGFSGANDVSQTLSRISLTNSTTITASRNTAFGNAATVSWELTEFY